MNAHELGNMLLSLKENPKVILWKWTDKGTQYFPLNIAGGRSPEGYVCLSTGDCNITDIIKEAEKKGMKEFPWSDYVDYKKVVEVLLENKEMLPAFMGIDKNFDKIIAEKLKE